MAKARFSWRLGHAPSPDQIQKALSSLKVHDDVQETFERTRKHLAQNNVDLENSRLAIGLPLRLDPEEKFVDNPAADAFLTREYRKPFVVPAEKETWLQPELLLVSRADCAPESATGVWVKPQGRQRENSDDGGSQGPAHRNAVGCGASRDCESEDSVAVAPIMNDDTDLARLSQLIMKLANGQARLWSEFVNRSPAFTEAERNTYLQYAQAADEAFSEAQEIASRHETTRNLPI